MNESTVSTKKTIDSKSITHSNQSDIKSEIDKQEFAKFLEMAKKIEDKEEKDVDINLNINAQTNYRDDAIEEKQTNIKDNDVTKDIKRINADTLLDISKTLTIKMQDIKNDFLINTNNDNKTINMQALANELLVTIKSIKDKETKTLFIDLKPEGLGKIQLKIKSENGKYYINIYTENNVVKKELNSNIEELLTYFKENGVNIGELDVSVNDQAFQQNSSNSRDVIIEEEKEEDNNIEKVKYLDKILSSKIQNDISIKI